MSVDSLRTVLVGGPDSGKTTYLGALWSTVQNAPADSTPRLRAGMPPRVGYLVAAESALMSGRPVARTHRDTGERVELDLVFSSSKGSVHYTDLAGETLHSILLERRAPEDLVDDLQGADALMVFIHPNKVQVSITIAEAARLAREAGECVEDNPFDETADVLATGDKQIWGDTESDIQLIELIQVCMELADVEREPFPIAIIVSAWDQVDPSEGWDQVEPREWLFSQLPLLIQFLDSNADLHPWRAFGVSAQGFDFEKTPDDSEVWDRPCSERTVVVEGPTWCHEITRPIEWLFDEVGSQ